MRGFGSGFGVFGTRSLVVAAGVSLLLAASAPAGAAAPAATTLYVASGGSDSAACTSQAPCATIGHAVAVAAAGDTISVGAGTYHEQVTITKPLTLLASGGATIDASGFNNGILVQGPGAAGTVVSGWRVEGATEEGILLQATTDATVEYSVVTGNDLGMSSKHPTGECAPQGAVPGDCGEGIHLMSATNSSILGNVVVNNSGGILVTDEIGPAAGNLIEYNYVVDNPWDCGITMASHSPKAMANGKPNGSAAGVYDNRVLDNTSADNGLAVDAGAGVLLAAAAPGAANYNNLIEGNTISGNGNSGVTIHSHAPDQYLGDNVITGNYFSNDNTEGDPDAKVSATVGVLVWSAVAPIPHTTITDNYFGDLQYGVWTHNATGTVFSGNHLLTGVAVADSLH